MKEPQDHKKSMKDILASARLTEKSVTLCLAGDLQLQFEELERRLSAAMKSPHATLAGNPEQTRLSQEIEAIREQMAQHEVTFAFRALPHRRWSDLIAQHPARSGHQEGFNAETFPIALLAESSLEPKMSVEDVEQLADAISNAQYSELFNCVWSCNQSALDVPFSGLASRVLRASETS